MIGQIGLFQSPTQFLQKGVNKVLANQLGISRLPGTSSRKAVWSHFLFLLKNIYFKTSPQHFQLFRRKLQHFCPEMVCGFGMGVSR